MKSPAVVVDNEGRVCGGAVSLVTREVSHYCPLLGPAQAWKPNLRKR